MTKVAAQSKKQFDLLFNQIFTPNAVYDIALPYLIRSQLFNPDDTMPEKVRKAQDFVHALATPGKGTRYSGLGTVGPNPGGMPDSHGYGFENTAIMLASGNMFCSEQAFAAAIMFRDKHHISRVDVASHTFAEVADGNRWLLVDPMFNLQLKTPEGRYANAKDIVAYVGGDSSRLSLPDPLPKEIKDYLKLFDPANYKGLGNERDRGFGHRASILAPVCTPALGVPFAEFMKQYKPSGIPGDDPNVTPYRTYLQCNMGQLADDAPQEKIFGLQDLLLDIMEQNWNAPMDWYTFKKKQYQLLGR